MSLPDFFKINTMPSPTEIANMFTQDTSGVESSNRFYAQLRAQKQAQEEQQKLQREKFEYDAVSDIGSFAPTNTAWDEKGAPMIQGAVKEYVDLGKSNPNMSAADRKQAIYPKLAKIAQWGQKAKLADAQIKPLLDMADKEMPWVDKRKLKEVAYQKAFYDAEGNLLDEPNIRWSDEVNLDDIEFAEKIANYDALPMMEQKKMKSLYAPQEQPYMGDGKTTPNIYVKKYDFEDFDPITRKTSLKSDKVKVGNTEFDVLREDAMRFVPSEPSSKLMIRDIKRELMQNEDFNKLPEDAQARTAMAEYMKRFGRSEESGKFRIDRTDVDNYRRMQQQDVANRNAARRLQLAEEANLRSAESHRKTMADKPNTPESIYSTIVAGTLRKENGDAILPEAQKIVNTKYGIPFNEVIYNAILPNLSAETKQEITNSIAKGNIVPNKGLMKMADLSAANGGFFTDPFTSEKYKLISVTDNNTNDVILTKIYQTQNPDTKKYEADEGREIEILDNPDQEMQLIGDQLKRKSDKTLNEQETNTQLILGQ